MASPQQRYDVVCDLGSPQREAADIHRCVEGFAHRPWFHLGRPTCSLCSDLVVNLICPYQDQHVVRCLLPPHDRSAVEGVKRWYAIFDHCAMSPPRHRAAIFSTRTPTVIYGPISATNYTQLCVKLSLMYFVAFQLPHCLVTQSGHIMASPHIIYSAVIWFVISGVHSVKLPIRIAL